MFKRTLCYKGAPVEVPLLEAGTPVTKEYAALLATAIKSDGCTGVPEFHHNCCVVHDLGYRFQIDPWGQAVSRAQVDAALRRCHQAESVFGRFSPMSWWRWAGVRIVGRFLWNEHRTAVDAGPNADV